MFYVLSDSFNPYFNLSMEEYLLKNSAKDFFILWRSEPSIIVGKHQNALAEINHSYFLKNKILIARRLSGGGTVVHDMQNLNFSFIVNGEEGKLIDFKKYVSPIIEYLETLSIRAHIGKTNDIRINELKISGNAEHVFRKRVLHHGTLLFNSDLNRLRQAINITPGKYIDKAVQSNRASVTNILQHLNNPMSIEKFTEGLIRFLVNKRNYRKYTLNNAEISEINQLKKDKYQTEEWIWGYSPKYTFKNSFNFSNKKWDIILKVEKGIIINVELHTADNSCIEIAQAMKNKHHKFEVLFDSLSAYDVFSDNSNLKVFLSNMF